MPHALILFVASAVAVSVLVLSLAACVGVVRRWWLMRRMTLHERYECRAGR